MREEAFETKISLADGDDEEVFEMLAGYKDEDGVIHKDFTLREITGKDEEAIQHNGVKSNGAKIINVLLSRCVTRIGAYTPKSLGKDKWEKLIKNLLVGDQDYIFSHLRKLSVGDEIQLVHVCPNRDCKAKLETFVDLDEFEIIPFGGNREIDFELPKGYEDKKGVIHRTGIVRLPNGLDRELLTPAAKANEARAETIMLTRVCTFEDGLSVDEEIMGNLVRRDRDYLQKLLRDNLFGVNPEIDITCDSCGETFKGSLNASNFI